jgi:hypothetical protein
MAYDKKPTPPGTDTADFNESVRHRPDGGGTKTLDETSRDRKQQDVVNTAPPPPLPKEDK